MSLNKNFITNAPNIVSAATYIDRILLLIKFLSTAMRSAELVADVSNRRVVAPSERIIACLLLGLT